VTETGTMIHQSAAEVEGGAQANVQMAAAAQQQTLGMQQIAQAMTANANASANPPTKPKRPLTSERGRGGGGLVVAGVTHAMVDRLSGIAVACVKHSLPGSSRGAHNAETKARRR